MSQLVPAIFHKKRARANGKMIFCDFSYDVFTSTNFPSNNFEVKTNAQQKLKNYDRNLPGLKSKFDPTNFRLYRRACGVIKSSCKSELAVLAASSS